jgi:hypothetical protein
LLHGYVSHFYDVVHFNINVHPTAGWTA